MRNDDQISNSIVGLLLELKEVILSKNGKHLIVDNLSKRINNYKKLCTNMKDNNIINLAEPSKMTYKESKRNKYVLMSK